MVYITVKANPEINMPVKIDGVPVGNTPITWYVTAGRHTIMVDPPTGYSVTSWTGGIIAPGHNSVTRDIWENTATTVNLSGPPPPPEYAHVTIMVSGEGSTDPVVGEHPPTWRVGDTLYVTAYPASGWRYELMKRNGVEHTRANPGEFLNLAETEGIEVVFVEEEAPPTPPPEADLLPVAAAIVTLCLLLVGGAYYCFTYVKS